MSTVQSFESSIKNFLSASVLRPLAEVCVENRDLDVDDLVKKFIDKLDLPVVVPNAKGVSRKRSPKSSSPKADQQWLTYDQYTDQSEGSFLCGYVQTRGKFKDHYCGVALDDTNVVSWSKDTNFVSSTPDAELKEVNGRKCEMRCKLCWARDPKTGEYKRKKGRGDKLISEHKGDIVAPSAIPGVSVPDNESLMGFLSGNSKTFVSPTRAIDSAKKVIRAKRDQGLVRNEDYSHVMPNPEHHNMPWLIRADSDGQVVIGKFESQPTPTSSFDDGYLEDLIPLDDSAKEICKEYNIEYKPYEAPQQSDDIDIPIVHDREGDTTTMQDIPDVPTLEIDDMLNNLSI
mgnify:FL=1